MKNLLSLIFLIFILAEPSSMFAQHYPPSTGGIPTYANQASLPASATNGAAAVTLDTYTMWLFDFGTSTWLAVGGSSVPLSVDAVGSSPNTNAATLSGNILTLQPANASFPGVLLAADWNTFNDKQASGNYITALTGDGSASGPGSATLTLATVNTNTGSYGSSTSIPSFAINGKGLITAAASNPVVAPAGTLTGSTLASGVTASSLTSVGTIGTGVWTGTTIAIANGGTGQISANAALNALLPSQTGQSGNLLTTNGTNSSWTSAGTGTVTSVIAGTGLSGGTITTSGTISLSTPVSVANGGTGQSSNLTQDGLIYATSTTVMATTAAGTSGQVMTSNGGSGTPPTWQTLPPPTHTIETSTGTQAGMLFTISTSSTCSVGDQYTNNGHTYTVLIALVAQSGQVLYTSGTGSTSGTTLTRSSGSGTSSITFSTTINLASYSPPSGTQLIKVTGVGSGGGGGGVPSAASNAAAAGGGGGAGSFIKYISSPGATWYYTVGSATSGGSAGANSGSTGALTAFLANGIGPYVANGGTGGNAGQDSTSTGVNANPVAGGVATGGDLNMTGGSGQPGLTFGGTANPLSGAGGSSSMGTGAIAGAPNNGAQTAGTAAGGYGAGGSGAAQSNNGGTAGGGNGSAGILLIDEFPE